MSRIVCCCYALFMVAGLSVCGPAKIQAQAPEDKPAINQPSLVELAKLYQELELPLPPKDAKIASVFTETNHNGDRERSYQLAFSFKNPNSDQHNRLWISFYDYNQKEPWFFWENFELGEIFAQPPNVDRVLAILKLNRLSGPPNDFNENRPELIFAIQCHFLGYKELSEFFYWRCQKSANQPFNKTLVITAWNYWVLELTDHVRDRRTVAAILQRINKNYKRLSSDETGSINQSDILLKRLELTLQPSKAKPGSVEALVDRLVDSHFHGDTDRDPDYFSEKFWDRKKQIEARKKDQRYDSGPEERKGLARLGFKAIPTLINHVDDPRLTRDPLDIYRGIGGNPSRTFSSEDLKTVGHEVRIILNSYFEADEDLINNPENVKKKYYIKKWDSIKNKTEYDFLVDTIKGEKGEFPFSQMIFDRFPDKILFFYKMILSQNQTVQKFAKFIYYIVDSDLPKAEKIDLLLLGVKHKSYHFQRWALCGLLELDNAIFTKNSLDLLSRLPKEMKENDSFHPHLELIRLALCTEDYKAQAILLEHIKKLPLIWKKKFICEPFDFYYRPSKINSLINIGSFLDDHSVYEDDNNSNRMFWCFGKTFKKLEISNLAAIKILEILNIEISLNDKTPEGEWEKIRAFVKDEVERRVQLEKAK